MTTIEAVDQLLELVNLHKKKLKFRFSAKDREAVEVLLKHFLPGIEIDDQWEAFNKGNET